MRRVWLGMLALALGTSAAPARAGVYQTVEPVAGPAVTKDGVEPMPFVIFRDDVVQTLPQIQMDKPNNKLRERYLELRDELLRKERTGRATEEDLVNLSAVLIRLGEPPRVIQLLTPHARGRTPHFMLLANLATANYLSGPDQLFQALEYQSLALASWPKKWPGLTPEQLQWYEQAERTFQALLRVRQRELKKPKEERLGLDPLFGPRDNPLRFVGESGDYEPGKLAAVEQAKLPKDAVALVQQLLVWLPMETRLYWLYGELLNAQGDIRTAREVLDNCLYGRGYPAKELLEHRQKLNEAVAEAAAARQVSWLPESGQLVAVGAVAAVVILALVFFQFRELFRRRGAGKG